MLRDAMRRSGYLFREIISAGDKHPHRPAKRCVRVEGFVEFPGLGRF
jgi:hypothetical protein